MTLTKSRRMRGPKAVKKAISLPIGLHEQVCEVSKEERQTYSAVISIALDRYFEKRRKSELEQAYRSYFGDEATRKEQELLGAQLWRKGAAGWQK